MFLNLDRYLPPIVRSSASASIGMEPDQLTIRRVELEGRRLTPLVKFPMEGPIVALTVGSLPHEDDPSVWFVEESVDGTSTLWRAVSR